MPTAASKTGSASRTQTSRKSTAKKTSAKKATSAKSASSKSSSSAHKKSSGRKYSPKASSSVEREMHAFKKGKLKSGSGKKVTNPKQAIAIGLSEARKSGAKVPPAKKSSKKTSSRTSK